MSKFGWDLPPGVTTSMLPGNNQADRLVRLPLGDPKSELLMLFSQPCHGLGKDRTRSSGESGNLQITDDVGALPIELAFRVLDFGQYRVRPACQKGSCRCEPHAAAVRLDQPLTDIALQLAELLRHRRRCQVQGSGGAGYRPERGDRMQSLKTLEVQHLTNPTQYLA